MQISVLCLEIIELYIFQIVPLEIYELFCDEFITVIPPSTSQSCFNLTEDWVTP